MSPYIIQEQLSWSYVRAVSYRAGFRLYLPEVDDHGIDGTIEDPSSRGMNRVDFQLKATTVYEVDNSTIRYDLRVQNYNQLVLEDDVPRILILFIMPDDDTQWLGYDEDELCLRKCAYWVDLMGQPPSSNASTRRVSVPMSNPFFHDDLHSMFQRLTV